MVLILWVTRGLQWSVQWDATPKWIDGLCQLIQAISRRKEEPIPKTDLSPDRGLQLTLVKPKSLVVAGHQWLEDSSESSFQ